MITTKWPRLLVVGQPVTEEQADEILIRTQEWRMLFSNDRAWLRTVADVAAEFGRPHEPERRASHDDYLAELSNHWSLMEAWHKRLGILNLAYLDNDQVMSAWIGGPHGWCDWSGAIGCSTYNIGKWPSTEEVTEDWTAIAAAFPYLDLTAQLLEEEGEGGLGGQWRVAGGAVEYTEEPTAQVCPPAEIERFAPLFIAGERGVSVSRLRSALARVARREDGEPQ